MMMVLKWHFQNFANIIPNTRRDVSWKVALNYEKQCFKKVQGFKQNLIKLAPNSIQTTSSLGLLFQELTLSFAKVNGTQTTSSLGLLCQELTLSFVKVNDMQNVHNFGKIKCSISKVHSFMFSCVHFYLKRINVVGTIDNDEWWLKQGVD
jgi:hypothetical protein